MDVSTSLVASYDYRLVALSILIAVFASYAALELAGEMRNTPGRIRYSWLFGGAFAMGTGIWGMHYVGMQAFLLPIPVGYDWPTVLASLLAAILGSGAVLYVLSRQTLRLWQVTLGSLFMGTGIALMHYVGMQGMRLRAMCVYSPTIVVLSVLLAITLSFVAIRIAFHFIAQFGVLSWPKVGCAFLLGLSISAMHYTGMAAVTFYPQAALNGSVQNSVSVSTPGLSSIVAITILILAIVLLSSIVDRKFVQRARELADSRLQTQLIFDSLKEGIVVLDRDRNIVKLNQAASVLLGIPETMRLFGEASKAFELFLPTGELVPPAAWPSALAFRGEFLQKCELKIRRIDTGETVIAEVNAAPILNSAGETIQVIVSYRDITQPKKIDEARLRLAAIVESSEDAIIGKDDKGIVTSWNLGAEKVFGYSSEKMVGQSIKRLLPDDRAHEEEEILARIKRGEIVDHIETMRKKKNGQFINVSLTISPIRDATGKIVGASKVARNITDRKRLESQLLQSQNMDAVGQLTGGIAHDFNNLLGVVIGNLDLLERQLQDNPAALKRLHTRRKRPYEEPI
jgi:PAS domain S-box-containing protein